MAPGLSCPGSTPRKRRVLDRGDRQHEHRTGHARRHHASDIDTTAARAGKPVKIASLARTGMNPDLKTVGASYGVIKFVGGASDIPHWSIDGH